MRETKFCSEHRMRFIRPTTTEGGISNDRSKGPSLERIPTSDGMEE